MAFGDISLAGHMWVVLSGKNSSILSARMANHCAECGSSCVLRKPITAQNMVHLTHSGSQSQCRIWFILSARVANHSAEYVSSYPLG